MRNYPVLLRLFFRYAAVSLPAVFLFYDSPKGLKRMNSATDVWNKVLKLLGHELTATRFNLV
jgi:hypothetical protein